MKLFAALIVTLSITNQSLNAQEFGATSPVSVAPGFGNYHPQLEVLGDGTLGVIWASLSLKNLYFAKQIGVDQFDVPIKLNPDNLDVQTFNWSGADLAVEQDNVYIVFHSSEFIAGNIYLVKSTDNGSTFGDTVRIDNLTSGYGQFPDIAVHNDTLFATYMKFDDMGLDPRYVLTRSVDGGASFESEVEAGSLIGDEACDCCQPEIVVSDERVIIFFRNNATNIRDIKAVISYDRGLTFTDWISVDDHNWLINACPSTGPDARFYSNNVVLSAYRTTVGGLPKIFMNEYDLNADASVNLIDINMQGASNLGINYPQIDYKENLIGVVWEGLGSGTDVFFNGSSNGVSGIVNSNAINVTNASGSESKPDIAIVNGMYHIVYSQITGAELMYCRVLNVTGLSESKNDPLTIFPNPINGNSLSLTLKESQAEEVTITLFDFTGRLISSFTAPINAGIVTMDLDNIAKGSYLIQVYDGKKIYESKIIK